MDVARVRNLLERLGREAGQAGDAAATQERLRQVRSPTEFRALLEAWERLLPPGEARELRVAATGPDWETHRDHLENALRAE